MPVKEILVLRSGGQPLFNFAPEGAPKIDTLIAGFLSAQSSFAQEIGEGSIQVVTFAENKFVYESRADLLFIIVITVDENEELYRVMLKELAKTFVDKYQQELSLKMPSSHLFKDFRTHVMEIFEKYGRMPQLYIRYPTAILPPEISQRIELLLNQVEARQGILRTALITTDGYVVSTKLHPQELQFALTQFQKKRKTKLPTYFTVSQTLLKEETKLFYHIVTSQIVLVATIRKDQLEWQCAASITPYVNQLASVDLSTMVKAKPETRATEAYADEVVLTPTAMERLDFSGDTTIEREFRDFFGDAGMSVVQSIDGTATIAEIRKRTGVEGRQLTEILRYLEGKGRILQVRFYPKLNTQDTRFLAYLETVGLPRDEYNILQQAQPYCDGQNSVRDIAFRLGVEHGKLIKILRKLGDYVEWLT